jgi:acyl dehydratase
MNAALDEIRVGAELVSPPYLLDAAAAKAYHDGIEQPPRRRQRPRGIHDDDDAARQAGFAAPIAGGAQTIAVITQFLAEKFGMRFMRGGRIEVSLTKPVFFGDTLTSHAKIVSVNEERAELQIRVANQRGEDVLLGTAAIRTNDA